MHAVKLHEPVRALAVDPVALAEDLLGGRLVDDRKLPVDFGGQPVDTVGLGHVTVILDPAHELDKLGVARGLCEDFLAR